MKKVVTVSTAKKWLKKWGMDYKGMADTDILAVYQAEVDLRMQATNTTEGEVTMRQTNLDYIAGMGVLIKDPSKLDDAQIQDYADRIKTRVTGLTTFLQQHGYDKELEGMNLRELVELEKITLDEAASTVDSEYVAPTQEPNQNQTTGGNEEMEDLKQLIAQQTAAIGQLSQLMQSQMQKTAELETKLAQQTTAPAIQMQDVQKMIDEAIAKNQQQTMLLMQENNKHMAMNLIELTLPQQPVQPMIIQVPTTQPAAQSGLTEERMRSLKAMFGENIPPEFLAAYTARLNGQAQPTIINQAASAMDTGRDAVADGIEKAASVVGELGATAIDIVSEAVPAAVNGVVKIGNTLSGLISDLADLVRPSKK